jgi:hypothetical protein
MKDQVLLQVAAGTLIRAKSWPELSFVLNRVSMSRSPSPVAGTMTVKGKNPLNLQTIKHKGE